MSPDPSIELPPVRIAYGVDISESWISVVRIERNGSKLNVEPCLSTRVDSTPALALAPVLDRMTAEIALGKAALAVAMPGRQCSARRLTAPFPSLSKAKKVLPSLLDIQLPFPLESCHFGFPIVHRTDNGTVEAWAVAARKEDIEQHLARCKEWRLDPHVLDHEGHALWATVTSPPDIIAYLGLDRTLWVTGHESHFDAAHAASTGFLNLQSDPAALSDWGDRARRILRTLPTMNRACRWQWTGPGATDHSIIASLEAKLRESDKIEFSPSEKPESDLAEALARRALGITASSWNFRSGTLLHPQFTRWRQNRVRSVAAWGLAAGLLMAALNIHAQHQLSMQHRGLDEALMSHARALTGLDSIPRGQEVLLAQRAREEQALQLAPFQRVFEPPLAQRLHHLLQIGAHSGLRYESLTLRPDTIVLQGAADDWDRCESLASRLRDDGWTVTMDRQDAIEVDYVRFRITAGRT